ncbi:MAG: O-antigen ligase family protein [Coriobacteriia bacterium]|nr:O-antigen ligase family protein [Coriobacteriia bacterium]
MDKIEIKKKKHTNSSLIVFFTIFNSLLIFYTYLPATVYFFISIIIYFFSYYVLYKKYTFPEIMLLFVIFTLPSSFVSVLGTPYSELPITFHAIFIFLLTINIMFKKKFDVKYVICIILFCIIASLQIVFVEYPISLLKQAFSIVLFLFSFLLIKHFSTTGSNNYKILSMDIYISSAFALGIQVLIQSYFHNSGINLGTSAEYAYGRFACAGLFGDYSFAGLFITSAIFLILIRMFFYKNINNIIGFILCCFLLLCVVANTSRTGIVSLVLALLLCYLINFRYFPVGYFIILIMCCALFYVSIFAVAGNRGGLGMFLDSAGRIENYIDSINFIIDKPLLGYGLGLDNLLFYTALKVPHNFFIQYLIQTGFIGMIVICLPFVFFVKDTFTAHNKYKWLFIQIAIASMLIPDIVSSRFLFTVIVIISMTKNDVSIVENQHIENC